MEPAVIEIHGTKSEEDGSESEIVARIHPAMTTEEGTFCVIEIPEIRESGYRIFGVDDAQAIELSHMPVERTFDHHGITRVED